MNTKSFEILDSTMFAEYLKSKGVSQELSHKWCNIIKENIAKFENSNYDEICDMVESVAIDGIDGDIISMTVNIITTDNDVEIEPGLAKCFTMYTRK